MQQFEDLDRVEGGAFAKLVAVGEKFNTARIESTGILKNSDYEHFVAPGSVYAYWKTIRLHIVYHCYARRLCKNGSRAVARAFAGSSPQQPTA